MPRKPRNDTGGQIYHVINRANARFKIFQKESDYKLFETTLMKALEKFSIKMFSYTNMPNHFHLVLLSEKANELSKFMQWLTLAFTQRWHVIHQTVGTGHLFQGRYKSFPINTDEHLLQVILYSERNAPRAGLVEKAEDWRWSSAWIRKDGNEKQKKMLSPWPIDIPQNYSDMLNKKDSVDDIKKIRLSINKEVSIENTINIKSKGRPRKST